MSGSRMHAETFAVLRHIEVHGPRSKVELSKGLQHSEKEVAKRLANLMMLGYLAMDSTTRPANFALTGKARVKLADRTAADAPAPPAAPTPRPKKVREAHDRTNALSAAQASRPVKRAAQTNLQAYLRRRHQHVIDGALTAPFRAKEFSPSLRPGANDAFALPSRLGDRFHYRDGRVTDLDGHLLD